MNYNELLQPLYHGSNISFSAIDLTKSIPKKDFGQGFYTTTGKFQAEKFTRLKAKRMHEKKGYVEVFKLNNPDGLNIKQFETVNDEWFDFVLINRGFGKYAGKLTIKSLDVKHDIVIGPVANDAVGLVLNQFIAGVYGDPVFPEAKNTAIRLLLTQKLHNQVFFGTEKAVLRLSFLEVYDVYID